MEYLCKKIFEYSDHVNGVEEWNPCKMEEEVKLKPGNAASMVLAVRYGEFDMLFTATSENGKEACGCWKQGIFGTGKWGDNN